MTDNKGWTYAGLTQGKVIVMYIKKKHIPIVVVALLPSVLFLIYAIAGYVSILGLLFVVPSALGIAGPLLVLCYLHEIRTHSKTGLKNLSLWMAYSLMALLIMYFSIGIPQEMRFNRPGAALSLVAYIFLCVPACITMTGGYLLGWVVEIVVRRSNETYRDEDVLRRKAFLAHLSKFKIVYIVIIIVIGGQVLLLAIAQLPSTGILSWSDIHYEAKVGNIRQVKKLLNNGIDVNAKENDSYKETPLHKAAMHDQQDMIEFLVTNSADINSKSSIGQTPLHSATRIGSNKTVMLLINLGADVNAQDNNGNTPLREAARKGRFEVVENLVNNGANVNLSNKGNQTPIFLSVWYGYKDVVELLLKNGAEVNFVDKKGRSPLSVAVAKKYKGIEKLLREHGAKE